MYICINWIIFPIIGLFLFKVKNKLGKSYDDYKIGRCQISLNSSTIMWEKICQIDDMNNTFTVWRKKKIFWKNNEYSSHFLRHRWAFISDL